MGPFSLTLGVFAAWWLIGVAALALARADTASLRVALTAPLVGTAVTLLPLFVLSSAGVAMENGALPATLVLLVCALAVVARRRPALPVGVVPVLAICVIGLALACWPMFEFGFRWLSNANDDMANYVLSATQLLHRGLLAPPDLVGLSHNRDYPSVLRELHAYGSRPGADIMLGALAGVTRRPAYELFMPLIAAFNLCTICGTAALALQATRRWWVAVVAAALIAVSPLATFGLLQQLLPQVWGLGLAAALFALLMRTELHRGARPSIGDIAPISLLTFAVILAYVELASTLLLAYAVYVGVLLFRREFDLRVVAWLWVPAVAFTAVVLNSYGIRELRYVRIQADIGIHGVATGLFGKTPGFGFTLIPSALAGIVGFNKIPVAGTSSLIEWSIAASAVLLLGALIAAVRSARQGTAATIVLVAYAALAAYLGFKSSDFGLYKLYMYVQPFLAAAVAIWLARARSRRVLAFTLVPLAAVVAALVSTQQAYVRDSRDPLALRHASSQSLIPAFRRLAATDPGPLVSVTENPTLGKLEAVAAGQNPLEFMSQNLFAGFMAPHTVRLNGWHLRTFELFPGRSTRRDPFLENTHASAALAAGRCTILVPSGTQSVLNRRSLPEGSPDIVARPCARLRNTLVFTSSRLGSGYYAFVHRQRVAFYPVERDGAFKGHTFSGFGRYVLLRIVRPAAAVRLEVDLSTTLMDTTLPKAVLIGTHRVPLSMVGSGSARVFSPTFRPQVIDGEPYVLLDLGRDGRLIRDSRPGLESLYGTSVPIDPRYLTAFVRDLSLVPDSQYRALRRPAALASFPTALADPNLEYSGIYENGWVAKDSYAVLAGGPAADLVIRAQVPPASEEQRLAVFLDGHRVAARRVAPGQLDFAVALPASEVPRRVDLRWRVASTKLPAPVLGPVSALLQYLGVVSATHLPKVLQHFPADLANPKLRYSGIFSDGWLKRQASIVLAGGAAADLVLRVEVPSGGQALQLMVNGRTLATRKVTPGRLELRLPVPASRLPRRIELRWAFASRLPAPDVRSASALLQFLGIVPRKSH